MMSEFPKLWRILILDEEVADEVIELVGKADRDGRVSVPPLTSDANDESRARWENVAEFASDARVIKLLRGDAFNKADVGDSGNYLITGDTLAWLRRLTPLN